MTFRELAAILALSLSLSGCAHGPDGTVGTAGAAYVEGDKFSTTWTVMGDRVTNGINPFGGQFGWRIRSFVAKDGSSATHQLYVDIDYQGSWRFYQTASDETGTPLAVTEIDQTVGDCSNQMFGCMLSEIVGVDLPEAEMRARADTGFQIQLQAKSGDKQVLTVTKEMIQQQFAKVDPLLSSARGQAPVAAAPTATPIPTPPAAPQPVAAVPTGPKTLGIDAVPTPFLMAPLLGVPHGTGMWVLKVTPGSAADAAGIEKGDVVVSIGGTPMDSKAALAAAITSASPGQSIPAVIKGAGGNRNVSLGF